MNPHTLYHALDCSKREAFVGGEQLLVKDQGAEMLTNERLCGDCPNSFWFTMAGRPELCVV